MTMAVIDACCLIDLLASGYAEVILSTAGYVWHLPAAVQREVQYVRRHDPTQCGRWLAVAADLSPLVSAGVLHACQPENDDELALLTRYAAIFRSDGEAMCMALAESRGWVVATDDRKAIRIGQGAGLTMISCPELVKIWADTARPTDVVLRTVLRDIQLLAQFTPNPSMPQYAWWMSRLP